MLQMALCDERLVALTSREVGVKFGGSTPDGVFFGQTTMEKIQTVKMSLAFPMCSLYEFWGKFNYTTLFPKTAIVIHDNLSVGKLQPKPVQLNYLCGVSDFAEAYAGCQIGRATPR